MAQETKSSSILYLWSWICQILKQFLRISCVSKNRYCDIVKLVYPHITAILDEMCEEEKNRMKEKDAAVLGSWKKAVVKSDGVWHTRGHFSKNGPFIIKNYLTGGLLWYGHKCMQGKDEVIDELYAGTAKSTEGVLAGECYKHAKDAMLEGHCTEIQRQVS